MTPAEPEQAAFFIQWWQQILSGSIVIITGLLLRAKGKSAEARVPMSGEEIEHRMTICKQDILLDLNDKLDERDAKLFKHIEDQDERMLDHIKDLLGAKR